HAIYDAMFAQASTEFLERERAIEPTGDVLRDLQAGTGMFVRFCTEDPVRYQLLFQRTIPSFEPSPESYAISVEALKIVRDRPHEAGLTEPRDLDLLTVIGAGIASQQTSNEPGGDRWTRLVDDAVEMFFEHVTKRAKKGTTQ